MATTKLRKVKESCDPFCCFPCAPCDIHIKLGATAASITFLVSQAYSQNKKNQCALLPQNLISSAFIEPFQIAAIIWLAIPIMIYLIFSKDPDPPKYNNQPLPPDWKLFEPVMNTVYVQAGLAALYLVAAISLLVGVIKVNLFTKSTPKLPYASDVGPYFYNLRKSQ